jgi:hypothetical protein
VPAVYLDADTYYALTGGQQPSSSDPRIDAVIEAASRLYDRAHGVAPGMFAPISSTALKFTATGGQTLYLRDTAGNQCFLRTITTDKLEIDDDADGSFDDYTWDLSDGWVRALPENASAFGEPYTAIELNPNHASAPITAWPTYKNSIQITGTWGFATTPVAVQMRVADIAHALSQRGYAGGYGGRGFVAQITKK